MTIFVSSLVLLFIFGWMVLEERKCAKRSKDFFKRVESDVKSLAETTQRRYRDRYGKDPTGGFPTFNQPEEKKSWMARLARRK